MKSRAHVVIVGAGVNGLGLAYQLAREGVRDIVVLERRYIPYGASGRNGGGVRAQWSTPENIALARESIRAFKRMSAELGFNVWFRQGGYLFLARREEQVLALKRLTKLQRDHGVRSRVVDAAEASILAPDLNLDGVVGGSFCPTDGIVFPWSVVFGYWQKCKEMGVEVVTFTGVTALETKGDRIARVETTRGSIETDWVVNAAGCWSPELAAMAGVRLPNKPFRHEIFVTEALKPFLDPMIVDIDSGLYANQDMRGEIVAGLGNPGEPTGVNFDSSLGFAKRLARNLVSLLPILSEVRVMRQWAGAYDVTPDNKPILGPAGYANFLQLHGASGHGFMIHPVTTRMTADLVLGRKPRMDVEPFLLERFSRPRAPEEDALVIG
ncbi:MAG TPA: FAD-binding oxidoreductase [Candidatus Thermoplasmatota archaeon]|nr:FAD-binding oxidoreductase [Candidatus Thermoplasmatota archaeon]